MQDEKIFDLSDAITDCILKFAENRGELSVEGTIFALFDNIMGCVRSAKDKPIPTDKECEERVKELFEIFLINTERK